MNEKFLKLKNYFVKSIDFSLEEDGSDKMLKRVLVLCSVFLLVVVLVTPSVRGDAIDSEGEEGGDGDVGLHHWLAILSSFLLVGAVVTGVILYFGEFSRGYSELRLSHFILGVLALLFFFLTSWVMI